MARQRRGQERAPTVHTPVVVMDRWTQLTLTQPKELMEEFCDFVSREGTIKRFGFKYSVSPGYVWKFINEDPGRREQYRQAMKARAESIAGRIAKSGERVERIARRLIPEEGRLDPRNAQAAVAAEKVLQDNLKWRAAKDNPEMYGERTTQVLEGGENPITFQERMSESEMSRRMAFILSRGLKNPPLARAQANGEAEILSTNSTQNAEIEVNSAHRVPDPEPLRQAIVEETSSAEPLGRVSRRSGGVTKKKAPVASEEAKTPRRSASTRAPKKSLPAKKRSR